MTNKGTTIDMDRGRSAQCNACLHPILTLPPLRIRESNHAITVVWTTVDIKGYSAAIYLGLMYKGYQQDPQSSPFPRMQGARSNVLKWKEQEAQEKSRRHRHHITNESQNVS